MNFIELIGFLITLIAFVVLSLKRTKEPSQDDLEGDDQQEDKLKNFLKALDLEMGEEDNPFKKKPPPARSKEPAPTARVKPSKKALQKSAKTPPPRKGGMEEHLLKSAADHRFKNSLDQHYPDLSDQIISASYRVKSTNAYDIVVGERQNSKGKNVIKQASSKKNLIILQEILKIPKAYE